MFCDVLQALRMHEGITYALKFLFFTMSEKGLLILCAWCPRQRNLFDIQKLF